MERVRPIVWSRLKSGGGRWSHRRDGLRRSSFPRGVKRVVVHLLEYEQEEEEVQERRGAGKRKRRIEQEEEEEQQGGREKERTDKEAKPNPSDMQGPGPRGPFSPPLLSLQLHVSIDQLRTIPARDWKQAVRSVHVSRHCSYTL